MAPPTYEQQTKQTKAQARGAAEVRVLEARIRDGRWLREAQRQLDDAERYNYGPAAVALARFAVALYSPLS